MSIKPKNDWPKWQSCSSPVLIAEEDARAIYAFNEAHFDQVKAWVKAEVNLKAWGEPWKPRHAISSSCAAQILSLGREYAERRLSELATSAIWQQLWMLWCKEHGNKSWHRLKKNVDEKIDVIRTLRSLYSQKYPPSVSAPAGSASQSK